MFLIIKKINIMLSYYCEKIKWVYDNRERNKKKIL